VRKQLIVLSVGNWKTKACNPIGMEVVNEVANLFAQESQQFVLIKVCWLTRSELSWMNKGYVSASVVFTPPR
jgi:hypothetical protein